MFQGPAACIRARIVHRGRAPHAIAEFGERALDVGDRRAGVARAERQPHLAARDLGRGPQADAGGGEPRPVERLARVLRNSDSCLIPSEDITKEISTETVRTLFQEIDS